jgi:hypothetical protein
MRKFPMKWGRSMAFCAVLACEFAPCALAQRVEPEVHQVDASVHAGVEEQARARALSQKPKQPPTARNAWMGSAQQPPQSLFRPGGPAAGPPSAERSPHSRLTTAPSEQKTAPPPAMASKPAFTVPAAGKHPGTFSSSLTDKTTPVRSHAPVKRAKVPRVIRKEKQK